MFTKYMSNTKIVYLNMNFDAHTCTIIIWNKTKLIKQSNNDLNEENLNGVQHFRFNMHCQINTLN